MNKFQKAIILLIEFSWIIVYSYLGYLNCLEYIRIYTFNKILVYFLYTPLRGKSKKNKGCY